MNGHCPPAEQLEQLLDDRLEAIEDATLARHVESCAECQARLERLFAGSLSSSGPAQTNPETPDVLLVRLKKRGRRDEETVEFAGKHPLADRPGQGAASLPEVPGYEVLSEIGRGGMGVIYKARHLRLGRVVALKMILAGAHAGSAELRRFRIEASAVARLLHPGIVGVYDVGEHEGLPYLSLELVEGGSLKQLLGGVPQPACESARLVEQLARAVQHAHEAGIVHRDLKPANVLLQKAEGRRQKAEEDNPESAFCLLPSAFCLPKITDFGLAKLLTEGPTDGPTQSGAVVGTPGYMAPEQAAGHQRQVGPAADVYALGAILYECLTGRPPFQAPTTLETLLQVMHDEPVSISSLQPRVPRDLATIAMRCLEKQPAKRYASARDLADDLARFLAGQPIHARRIGPLERGWRWCKRNPVVAGLASSLLVALVVGIAGVSWKWWEADQRRQEAEERRREVARAEKDTARERDAAVSARNDTAKERDEAVRARRETQRSRAGILLDKGVALAEQGEVAQGLFWMLEGLVVAEEARDGPLQEVIRTNLGGWLGQAHALRQVHGGNVTCGAFSADGKRFALGYTGAVGEKSKVQVYDSATGKPVGPPLEHEGDVAFIAFGPDGKTLVTSPGWGARFQRWDLTTYRALGQPFAERKGGSSAALSPDGNLLAVGDKDGLVRLWDVERQRMVRSMAHDKALVKEVVFSSDGKTLRTCTTRLGGGEKPLPPSSVYSWDVATGKRIGQVRLPAGEEAFRFGPAGATILTVDDHSLARVRHGEIGRIIGSPLALARGLRSACFAPDGRMIVLIDHSGACEWWDGALGQPVVGTLPPHGGAVLAFSPCGKFVLLNGASLWEVARAPSRPPFRSSRKTSRGGWAEAAYSPDRRSALVGDNRGVVRLVDPATGRPRGVPLRVPWSVAALAFSPDGKRFAVASHDKSFDKGGSTATVCYLCDSFTGRPIGPPLPHVNWVAALAFSPDSKVLATGGYDHAVHLWEATTGKRIGRPMLQKSIVLSLDFSPDGKTLAVRHSHEGGVSPGIDLVDVAAWKPRLSLKDWTTGKLCFSPDSKVLAIRYISPDTAPRATRLWDATTGRQIGKELDDNSLAGCPPVFSSDGRWMLTGGREGHLWEAATGKPVGPPLPQPDFVTAVAFSPDRDSRLLLIGGADGAARLWDRATYKPLGPPVPLTAHASHAAFLPNGRSFITTGSDGQVRQWPAPGPLAGSVAQLRLRLRVRTGLTMSPLQAVVALSREEWQKARDRLAAVEGSLRGARADFVDDRTWHDLRAGEAIEENAWFTALWHLDRLLALGASRTGEDPAPRGGQRPEDAGYHHFLRAKVYAALGQFDRTTSDLARAEKLASAAEVRNWCAHALADSEVSGAWATARWYLDRAIAQAPKNWLLYARRAEVLGKLGQEKDREADLERAVTSGADGLYLVRVANDHAVKGRWAKAAERFAQARALGPLPLSAWHQYALVRLKLRDRIGYRRLCLALLKGAGTRPDPLLANSAAWVCSVGPGGLDDYKSVATLAEGAVVHLPAGDARHQMLNTLGAVYYRSGRYQDAIDRLAEGIRQGGKAYIHDILFLAMAHHQAGRAKEAKRCLTKARATKPAADAKQFWQNLEIGLLLEEVEALLATPPRGKL